MKIRLKQIFFGGVGGVFIGLFISMLVSYLDSPVYLPLSPRSPVGRFFISHQVHVSLMMLYCLLIWFIMGAIFRWSASFFQKDWSMLRSILSHYLAMISTFTILSNLAGFFPAAKLLPLTLTTVVEFTIIYLVILAIFYYTTYRKIQIINQGLAEKN